MNRPAKIAVVVVGIVAVLFAVVLILAKLLVTPERIRATVLPIAQEKLHRDVQLGDIEVSLFSGVVIHDLAVRERGEDETFVAADRVVMSYRFWPLLLKRVVINEILLDAPRIRLVRFADGTFNFSDLMGQKEEEKPKAEQETGKAPVDLLVSKVVLNDGEIVFLDHALGTEAPYRLRLTGVSMNARDISLDESFPFRMQARFNQSSLDVEGEADLDDGTGKAKVLLQDLDLTAFTPYFQKSLPGKLASMRLDLDLSAEGGREALESKGKVALKGIDLTLDSMQDVPLRNTELTLDYALKADLQRSTLEIGDTTAALNGIPLHLSGKVEDYTGRRILDVTATLDDLDLEKAVSAAPDALVRPLAGKNPAGVVNARLHLAGSAAEPMKLLRDGEVRLNTVEFNAGGLRPSLTGSLRLSEDVLTAKNLLLQIGKNVAAITLQAENLLAKPLLLRADVTSDEFLLDPLLQAAAAPAAAPEEKGEGGGEKAQAPRAELGPFDIPVTAEGSVKVGKGIYHGLTISDFELDYRLKDNILNILKLTGRTAGGTFTQAGRVDLAKKGLAYESHVKISGIQADPLVSALFPKAGGTVFGALNLDTEVQGRGTLPSAIRKTLSGKGSMLLSDGKITGAGLVQGLADFLNLEELRILQFSRADGSFTVENGRLRLNSDLTGKDVRMAPNGTVGLDGSLDVALDLRLAPQLVSRLGSGKITQLLKDSQGWGQIPLKLTGTLGSPRFALDTSAATGRVKEKARQEIRKKLEERIFEKLGPKEGEGEKNLEPDRKRLEDTLKGLFGQ